VWLGQVRTCLDVIVHIWSGEVRLVQVRSGYVWLFQVRSDYFE
jgi:hypothetical protein